MAMGSRHGSIRPIMQSEAGYILHYMPCSGTLEGCYHSLRRYADVTQPMIMLSGLTVARWGNFTLSDIYWL
jgi:prolipoprotein diacylglyceryltransferase